jgi:hypothetical protein
MTDLLKSIQDAKGYDDLQPVLDDLSKEALSMAEAEHSSAEKVQTMNTVLAEVRLLLNELTHREVRSRGTSRHAVVRHLELESRIKEIGSVLDLAIKRAKA